MTSRTTRTPSWPSSSRRDVCAVKPWLGRPNLKVLTGASRPVGAAIDSTGTACSSDANTGYHRCSDRFRSARAKYLEDTRPAFAAGKLGSILGDTAGNFTGP